MVNKLILRKQRENEAVSSKTPQVKPVSNDRVVSDRALFNSLGNKIKVVKKD
jgi:hypothetical protein